MGFDLACFNPSRTHRGEIVSHLHYEFRFHVFCLFRGGPFGLGYGKRTINLNPLFHEDCSTKPVHHLILRVCQVVSRTQRQQKSFVQGHACSRFKSTKAASHHTIHVYASPRAQTIKHHQAHTQRAAVYHRR